MDPLRNEIELGAALRGRREDARLTQAQLAARAGVSRGFVIDIERGRRPRAELHRVLAMMRALDAALVLIDHRERSTEQALADLIEES